MGLTVELITHRLRLRLVTISDLEWIHELHSLPETDKYNTLGIPNNLAETKSVIQSWIIENQQEKIKNYTFAIENTSTRKGIGLIGFKLGVEKYKKGEVWFKLHSNQWSKGYATESLKKVIDFGFKTLHLHRIEAGCAVANTASMKVLEKVGMYKEGRKRQILPLKSGWSDNFEFSILETDIRK